MGYEISRLAGPHPAGHELAAICNHYLTRQMKEIDLEVVDSKRSEQGDKQEPKRPGANT
jgi:hypothetical protein